MDGEQGRSVHPFLVSRLESPELRLRVEAAERLGISVRRFDGWEPETVTTYEYDTDGRVVRSITVSEPEFDEWDRAWFLALAAYREAHCPGCGGLLSETTNEDNEDRYKTRTARCYKCTALAQSAEKVAKAAHSHAVLHMATLKT